MPVFHVYCKFRTLEVPSVFTCESSRLPGYVVDFLWQFVTLLFLVTTTSLSKVKSACRVLWIATATPAHPTHMGHGNSGLSFLQSFICIVDWSPVKTVVALCRVTLHLDVVCRPTSLHLVFQNIHQLSSQQWQYTSSLASLRLKYYKCSYLFTFWLLVH